MPYVRDPTKSVRMIEEPFEKVQSEALVQVVTFVRIGSKVRESLVSPRSLVAARGAVEEAQ